MPSYGGEPDYRAIEKRRRKLEARARAKGIIEGSSGWARFMHAHRRKLYRG